MNKLMLSAAATAGALVGAVALPMPSLAQQPTQSEVVVFGTDPCPRASDDQIVVCRRLPESMRYRLPDAYRPTGTRQERESWANKSQVIQTVGDTGPQSCSPVGPGGHTGCLVQTIREARDQRRQQSEDNQPPQQ